MGDSSDPSLCLAGAPRFWTSYNSVCWTRLRASSPAPASLTAACTTSFTGLSSPIMCSSRWQWQFTGVWTAAFHCRTTVSRPPMLTLGDSCVPATVNFLQYHVTSSILMVAGPFQLPTPQSGTLSRILSGTRPSVQTVSDVCLRRICLLDTSALSALEVLWRLLCYISTYLLTSWNSFAISGWPSKFSINSGIIWSQMRNLVSKR